MIHGGKARLDDHRHVGHGEGDMGNSDGVGGDAFVQYFLLFILLFEALLVARRIIIIRIDVRF